MVEGKSIEFLAGAYTVGVIAGTLVPAGAAAGLSALLLPLLALSLLFGDDLRKLDTGIPILAIFLLLGIFCALSASLPGPSVPSHISTSALALADRLRAHIDSLPFPSAQTAPLLKALLTGDKTSLSPGTIAAFRQSGASHILALSGLHIGIIYLFFDKISWTLGRSAPALRLRFFLIIGGAGFFTLMTGAGPSIVRAFLFISINETLKLLGRPRKASRVLCLALLLQLVLDPSAIKSLGFQLSYLAMGGLFLLYPVMEKWYPEGTRLNPLRRIWQAAALSISCQLFTAPLAWYRFHSFPRYFLLTNLMALPLTTGLMASALLTLIISAAGIQPTALCLLTDRLCRLLTAVLEIIASL